LAALRISRMVTRQVSTIAKSGCLLILETYQGFRNTVEWAQIPENYEIRLQCVNIELRQIEIYVFLGR
jgi:hypothetical protein